MQAEKKYMPHPSYGDQPMDSGVTISRADIESAHWSYKQEIYFPQSAIWANIEKQNYGYHPRRVYVDIAKRCQSCDSLFIFYAKEQQFWYEKLGFYVDSDCHHCTSCRPKLFIAPVT